MSTENSNEKMNENIINFIPLTWDKVIVLNNLIFTTSCSWNFHHRHAAMESLGNMAGLYRLHSVEP
jgi:hypothetical protein